MLNGSLGIFSGVSMTFMHHLKIYIVESGFANYIGSVNVLFEPIGNKFAINLKEIVVFYM